MDLNTYRDLIRVQYNYAALVYDLWYLRYYALVPAARDRIIWQIQQILQIDTLQIFTKKSKEFKDNSKVTHGPCAVVYEVMDLIESLKLHV